MFISSRQIEAQQGKMSEAISLVTWVIGAINDRHGGDMHVSVEIGGNPNLIGVTGRWDSLGAYEAGRASYMADPEIQGAISLASGVASMLQDQLGQILRPPGERQAFAAVNFARAELSALAEAIPFCLEVAEKASELTSHETGVFRAVTGDASAVGWVTFVDSLQTLQDNNEKLFANAEFLDFYKRSSTCMVPGSLVNTVRQYIA